MFNPAFPPRLVVPRGLDDSEAGGAIFLYTSPTDSAGTVGTAGYFPDTVRYGMDEGDMLFVWDQISKVIVALVVVSFAGTSPNFEIFSGNANVGGVPRFVVQPSDEITSADFGGTVTWLQAAGGTQEVIAGPSGRSVDITFNDQAPLAVNAEIMFVGEGCTINGKATFVGPYTPYGSATLRWDGNNNWMEI